MSAPAAIPAIDCSDTLDPEWIFHDYLCIHEAGHALVGYIFGHRFGRVSVLSKKGSRGREGSAGRVLYSLCNQGRDLGRQGHQTHYKRRAAVCFAGEQAVRVVLGDDEVGLRRRSVGRGPPVAAERALLAKLTELFG